MLTPRGIIVFTLAGFLAAGRGRALPARPERRMAGPDAERGGRLQRCE